MLIKINKTFSLISNSFRKLFSNQNSIPLFPCQNNMASYSVHCSHLKTQVLNDLDGGRGSGMEPKKRSRFTATSGPDGAQNNLSSPPPSVPSSTLKTLQNPHRPQPIRASQTKSTENFLAKTNLQNRPRIFHPSLENLHRPSTASRASFIQPLTFPEDLISDLEKELDEERSSLGLDREDQEEDYDSIYSAEADAETDTDKESNEIDKKSSILEENMQLKSSLELERKTMLRRKVCCAFAFAALRRTRCVVEGMESQLQRKKEEVAARMILHNLLLNSWRMKSSELSVKLHENSQLHKTVDNLCLQLRVVRHLQTTEKEKFLSKNREFEALTGEMIGAREENGKIRKELDSVSTERNALSSKLEELETELSSVSEEYRTLADKKDVLLRGNEKNKVKADRLQRDNEELKYQISEVQEQLKELTKQSSHWQEKALAFESDCWEQKLHIQTKESTIKNMEKDHKSLAREMDILSLSKNKAEEFLSDSKAKLEASLFEKEELESKLFKAQSQLKEITKEVSTLTLGLNRLKGENKELRNTLFDCSLKNVRRRRAWGGALYFLFNPVEMIRTLCFRDSPNSTSLIRPTN